MDDLDNLDAIDKMLSANARNSILQEMGLQNLNNYLILDERQEETKRIAANVTPKKFSEMVDKLSETYTGGVVNAASLLDLICDNSQALKTGIPELDNTLDGGIFTNKITEITGISGSGKTRFCHKLILSILATTGKRVLYIDSGASFSIDRVEHYCTKYKMIKSSKDKETMYSRVKSLKALNPKELLFVLISLSEKLSKGDIQIDLVIIDCFSSIVNINGELIEYEECLTEIYRLMKMLNSNYFVGFLVTTIAKMPINKSQKPRSILTTPWNFMPQTSLLIENMTGDNKADTQKGFYRFTLLSSEYKDDMSSCITQFPMHPTSQRD